MNHDGPTTVTQFRFDLIGTAADDLCRLVAGICRETPAELLPVRADKRYSVATSEISDDLDKTNRQQAVAIRECRHGAGIQS